MCVCVFCNNCGNKYSNSYFCRDSAVLLSADAFHKNIKKSEEEIFFYFRTSEMNISMLQLIIVYHYVIVCRF